jgi:hypothetical protein
MRMTRTASPPFPAGASPFGNDTARGRLGKVLRELWLRLISLPDRGREARPDDVPREVFRFPPF